MLPMVIFLSSGNYMMEVIYMSIEDMLYEINEFINEYDGTIIGSDIKNKLDNLDLRNYDQVEAVYLEMMDAV